MHSVHLTEDNTSTTISYYTPIIIYNLDFTMGVNGSKVSAIREQ